MAKATVITIPAAPIPPPEIESVMLELSEQEALYVLAVLGTHFQSVHGLKGEALLDETVEKYPHLQSSYDDHSHVASAWNKDGYEAAKREARKRCLSF